MVRYVEDDVQCFSKTKSQEKTVSSNNNTMQSQVMHRFVDCLITRRCNSKSIMNNTFLRTQHTIPEHVM